MSFLNQARRLCRAGAWLALGAWAWGRNVPPAPANPAGEARPARTALVDCGDAAWFHATAVRLLRTLPGGEALLEPQSNDGRFRIPLWPTNACTPAVHRLLQLAANLHDATCAGQPSGRGAGYSVYFPTVFRPVFRRDEAALYLVRFEVVTNHVAFTNELTTAQYWRDLDDPAFRLEALPTGSDLSLFLYNLPPIFGAKKGFPNFNQFTLDTETVVSRKVEMRKLAPDLPPSQTNQAYVFSMAHRLGFEVWNPYDTAYPGELVMFAANQIVTELRAEGQTISAFTNAFYSNTVVSTMPAGLGAKRFAMMLFTNATSLPGYSTLSVLSSAHYCFEPNPHFVPWGSAAMETNGFPLPDLAVAATNRFIFFLFDRTANRLIDCVSLSSLGHATNLMDGLGSAIPAEDQELLRLWDSRRLGDSMFSPTAGIQRQIDASLGLCCTAASDWLSYSGTPMRSDFIAALRRFCTNDLSPPQLSMMVGFNPVCRLNLTSTWQANDPLLHSHVDELFETAEPAELTVALYGFPRVFPQDYNLGLPNRRYRPWPDAPFDGNNRPHPYDLAIQDPYVRSAEDWDFPEAQPLTATWLGRVHRGTPWQTLYLKAEVASLDAWKEQTGAAFAPETHPTNDWIVASLLADAWNTNPPLARVSVNERDAARWGAVWEGLQALTNATDVLPEPGLPGVPPPLTVLTVRSNSPQVLHLMDAIEAARQARPRQRFHALAELLAVADLSVDRLQVNDGLPAGSPFLRLASFDPLHDLQQRAGLSDAAYEILPAQVLERLRNDLETTVTLGDSAVGLEITVWPGYRYSVQASADLEEWSTITAPILVADSPWVVSLPVQPGGGPWFYRVQLER